MLFLPFADRLFSFPAFSIKRLNVVLWSILLVAGLMLIVFNPNYSAIAVSILLFTALPEEWFFRSYYMMRLEQHYRLSISTSNKRLMKNNIGRGYMPCLTANFITSVFFALLHVPIQGWFGLAVFFPSLLYGWVYQKTRDLILVILLHSFSNLVFIIYIAK